MSRVTRTSKVYPGIKVSGDCTDNAPKPYLGYNRNRGMPSAYTPVEEYSPSGGDTFDKTFKHQGDKKISNAKPKKLCRKVKCDWYSIRKGTNCNMYPFDISKCKRRKKCTK